AGEAPVVVPIRDAGPALIPLAGDVRDRALALGVEAVELLVQSFLGALARVDRAADGPGARLGARGTAQRGVRGGPARNGGTLGGGSAHAVPFLVSPKNRNPFQCDPVIAVATAERD